VQSKTVGHLDLQLQMIVSHYPVSATDEQCRNCYYKIKSLGFEMNTELLMSET